jgi:uncharacterized protein (TIGR02246 family)
MTTLPTPSLLLLAVAMLTACATADMEPAYDYAADRQAIEAMREAEQAAAEAGDVDAFVALMASDMMVMPPNGPAVSGLEASRQWAEDFMGAYSVSFSEYNTDDVIVSDDLAVERISGVWTVTPKAGGDPVTERVKGVHIYRRQADGSWKMTHDLWNSDDPLPGM